MSLEVEAVTPAVLWAGRILSGLAIAFLVMDAGMKLVPIKPVIDAMQGLGFQSNDTLARGLGMLLMACTLLYAFPKTAPLGALLLTGYLGGAIAVQLRVGAPWFTHVLFGGYIGLMVWAGLLLRHRELRALLFPVAS